MQYSGVAVRFTAIAAAALVVAGAAHAETRVFSTTSRGKTEQRISEYRETREGGLVRIIEEGEEGFVSTLLTAEGTVVSTEFRTKQGSIQMTCENRIVETKGTWKDKPVSGRCELKDVEFYGYGFSFALRALAQKELKSLKFPVVHIEDPSKVTLMELKHEGFDSFMGRKAIKVKLSLTGAMAALWSARFLIGEDGTVYRFEGNQGPGTPNRVTELVEIRK